MASSEISILVTTDNHLGYMERDHIRGEDSFRAFEEVFLLAKEKQADCVLICGDLFHDSHPSKYTIYRAVEILKKYCVGDAPRRVECMDNGVFHTLRGGSRQANTSEKESGPAKIALPVFAIHGNHDEPSGYRGVAALDILAEAGLLNYFGSIDPMARSIIIRPVVLVLGATKVNIYGVGAVRDERMNALLLEGRISIEKQEGINLLVLHQTRCGTGHTHVSEDLLPEDIDLVIWGHMHESVPMLQKNTEKDFYTLQPGSTVQTSLCQAESPDKHCVLFKATGPEWRTRALPMQQSRRFFFRKLVCGAGELEAKAELEVEAALAQHTNENLLPLIRIRAEIDSGERDLPAHGKILRAYRDRIANPRDALRVVRRKKREQNNCQAAAAHPAAGEARFAISVGDVKVLPEVVFVQSILECIEKEDKTAITRCYNDIVQHVVAALESSRWIDIDNEMMLAVREAEKKLAASKDALPSRKKKMEEVPDAKRIREAAEDGAAEKEEDYTFSAFW